MWLLVAFMFIVGFVLGYIYREEKYRARGENLPLSFECPACSFKVFSNNNAFAVEAANEHMKTFHFKEV